MIQLRTLLEKESNTGTSYFPKTMFVCSECDTIATFYSIPPKICAKCELLLPDLRQLMNSSQVRKDYHLSYNMEVQ